MTQIAWLHCEDHGPMLSLCLFEQKKTETKGKLAFGMLKNKFMKK
jgi:hypothetical protein